MDVSPRILRVPVSAAAVPTARSADKQLHGSDEAYVLLEASRCPPLLTSSKRDYVAMVSKLNGISSQMARFQQSITPCVFAAPRSSAYVGRRARGAPQSEVGLRSPSEGAKSSGAAERARKGGSSARPGRESSGSAAAAPAGITVPDVESCWLATSPLPPTAVLAALYGLLPLRQASLSSSPAAHGGGATTTTESGAAEGMPDGSPAFTQELRLLWALCRATPPSALGTYHVSQWEAFCMAAVAAHTAVQDLRRANGDDSRTVAAASSSTSALSLAEQVRRAQAALNSTDQGGPTGATATLLEWPEELLWSLLIALLAALALVHSAGLHFGGQLTAADVLCFSCAASLPRLLEQTWRDVASGHPPMTGGANTVAGSAATSVGEATADAALFRRFYTTAVPSVILPQAAMTADTPCHSAFFVVQPSAALLSARAADEPESKAGPAGGNGAGAGEADTTSMSAEAGSAAQEVADETPAQQARCQAADLASVGRLLASLLDMRARYAAAGSGNLSGFAPGAGSFSAAAHPSSELVFLVRRLTECETAAAAAPSSAPPPRGSPTALQLLQLQAMRLRTEAWYYRRLAAEAYDRLAYASLPPPPPQQSEQAASTAAVMVSGGKTATAGGGQGLVTTPRKDEAELLRAREAAVAEREAKLDLILRVYELTHEHLDAVPLPPQPAATVPQEDSAEPPAGQGDSRVGHTPDKRTAQDSSFERLLLGTTDAKHSASAGTMKAALTTAEVDGAEHLSRHVAHGATAEDAVRYADISADGLLGLSPLARPSVAEDVDATLLSASATPFASFQQHTDQSYASAAAAAADDSAVSGTRPPATHRHLDVDEHSRYVTSAPLNGITQSLGSHALPTSHAVTPFFPTAVGAVGQGGRPSVTQPHASLLSASPPAPAAARAADEPSVTVVEVELDEMSDADTDRPARRESAAGPANNPSPRAPLWDAEGGRATNTVQPAAQPWPHTAFQTRGSMHEQQTGVASATPAALDQRTPARAPALPNMGVSDAEVSGLGAAARSHSRYSALALLRTPPSARRPVATATQREATHSPESQRSSTRPYTAAGGTETAAQQAAARDPPSQRSARRRSGSRGSSGARADPRSYPYAAADGSSGSGVVGREAGAAGSGGHVDAAGGSSAAESADWARQQLTALHDMQTALRAQQPATPRSRASAALLKPSRHAAAAAASPTASASAEAALQRTPDQRQPLSAGQSALSTPPTLSSHATPPRPTGAAHRSPVHTDSSRRTQSAGVLGSGGGRSAERPAPGQGMLWSAPTNTGAGIQRTPVSGRRSRGGSPGGGDSPYSTPHYYPSPSSSRVGGAAAGPRPVPVLTGRTTPPAKPSGGAVWANTALSHSEGPPAGGGRWREERLGDTPHSPAPSRGAGAYHGSGQSHRVPSPSNSVAALEAALRTPPRQTVPVSAASHENSAEERHRLVNPFYPSHLSPASQPSGAAAPIHAALSARTVTSSPHAAASARGPEETSARLRGRASRPGTAASATRLASAARSQPHRGSSRSGVRELPRNTQDAVTGGPAKGVRGGSAFVSSAAGAGGGGVGASVTALSTPGRPTTAPLSAGKAGVASRSGGPTTSAMELLRRLRASSTTAS